MNICDAIVSVCSVSENQIPSSPAIHKILIVFSLFKHFCWLFHSICFDPKLNFWRTLFKPILVMFKYSVAKQNHGPNVAPHPPLALFNDDINKCKPSQSRYCGSSVVKTVAWIGSPLPTFLDFLQIFSAMKNAYALDRESPSKGILKDFKRCGVNHFYFHLKFYYLILLDISLLLFLWHIERTCILTQIAPWPQVFTLVS